MKWEYMREEEFEGAIERSGGLCVLPIGCMEKHGQHLPVGCDSIHARGLVELAAEKEDVMIFPAAMWLGDVTSYHALQGTLPGERRNRGGIGLKISTLLLLLEELCDEIHRNGFRKILLVNGHGGNQQLLHQFIRAQGYGPKPYATMWTNGWTTPDIRPDNMYRIVRERREEFSYLTEKDLEAMARFAETGTGGGHGEWMETAFLYAFCPEYVAADRFEAESGASTHRADYLKAEGVHLTFDWQSNFPNAYDGFPPIGCSENIGKAMTALAAERLARIFKMLKEDEDCVRMAMLQPRG